MKEEISKAPKARVKRIPVGARNRLEVIGKDPNFVYRIVNDVDDRVERFKQAGYDVVDISESRMATQRVGQGTATGSIAEMPVGGGIRGVLMKIPKEWYEEDQKTKSDHLEAIESSIKKPNIDGAYGEIKIS